MTHDVPVKRSQRGTKMLVMNPVVLLPLPVALFILGALAYAALRYGERWPQLPTSAPRHRLTDTREAYRPRPWTEITVETPTVPVIPGPVEPAAYGVLDRQVPLAEVEEYLRSIGCADWHQPLTDYERAAGVVAAARVDEDTRELEMVA